MTQEFFNKNRQKLKQIIPDEALAIVSAATEIQRSNDDNYPFRQDSNFWYLTGIDKPHCTVAIAPTVHGNTHEELLFIPDPDEFHDLWLGGNLSVEEAKETYGFENVFYNSQKADILRSLIAKSKSIMAPDYETYSRLNATPNSGGKRLHQQLKRYGAKRVDSLSPYLTEMRMIKTREELELLEQNVEITLKTLKKVEAALPNAKNERDIAALITYEFMREGGRNAYGPIVAGGGNACTIHYTDSNQALKVNELLLIDAGIERGYYNADITRTYSTSGSFSNRQQEVYEAVQTVHEYAASMLKPGLDFLEYERAVRECMHEELIKLALLKKDSRLRDTLAYFPHATSHHLGVDVHDVTNFERRLAPHMVLTIEPGIYIPEEGIGVRIEDDVVITKDGCRILGQDATI